jgi:DNA-binding IclR family transcriptional regulator
MNPKRKPSIKSRHREPVVAEDVLRAVLCESRSEAEIVAMTGATRDQVTRLLGSLITRGLVMKTEEGYVPAQSLRQVG